jgi:hypothetical protein
MEKLPYGDWVGKKEDDHTRLWYQNVRGLSARNDLADAYQAALIGKHHDADILAMAETNLDWTGKTKGLFCKQVKQVWPVVTITTTSSTETFDTAYQPGGAALLIPNGLSGRVCSRHEDDMGRFTSVVLQGRGARKLAIICGYRVCVNHITGDKEKTAFAQQWRMLRRRMPNAQADPREAFLRDMRTHIATHNDAGIPSILEWDANEPVDTPTIQKFMRDCQLEEAYEHRFPGDKKPATHRDGTTKIDHIMLSPQLIPYIAHLGIDTFGVGIPSDHRPFYMDLRLSEYLQGNAAHIEPPRGRSVHTNDPRVVQAYCNHLQTYLTQHNYKARMQRLAEMPPADPDLPRVLETTDKDMTQGRAYAAKRLGKRFQTGWSPQVHEACRTLQYWKTCRAAKLNPHRDYSRALHEYEKELDLPPLDPALSDTQIRHRVRSSAKDYQVAFGEAATLRSTFLERKAEAYADARQTTKAAELKQLKTMETLMQRFGRLRSLYKPTNTGGLKFVLTPKADAESPWDAEPEYDLEAIESLLLQRNHTHFQQAKGTPPTKPGIAERLGHGETPFCDAVLNGTAKLNAIRTPRT